MNGSADSTKICFTPDFCEKFSSYLLHLPPCLDLNSNRQVKKETLARAETCFAKFRPKSFFFWQTFPSWFPPGQARREQNCPFQISLNFQLNFDGKKYFSMQCFPAEKGNGAYGLLCVFSNSPPYPPQKNKNQKQANTPPSEI